MFQIVIVPNNSAANTALSYSSKDNFDMARKNIHEKMKIGSNLIVQDDDAGQTVEINADTISYCMYINIEKQQGFAIAMKASSQPKSPLKTLEEEMAA